MGDFKDKLVFISKNRKKVKNNLIMCTKIVIKIYKPFDLANSTFGSFTSIHHQKRYRDEVITIFEILSKEVKERKDPTVYQ